jgi:ubiquinone/menaquinone biosynthesis C-methylase UbiE
VEFSELIFMTDVHQVTNFYQTNRQYWRELSAFQSEQCSYMLNFGFWPNGIVSLGDAQIEFIKLVKEKIGHPLTEKNSQGLEIGCGIGGVSIYLLKTNPALSMTGLDIVQSQLNIAETNATLAGVGDRFQTQQGSSMALPLTDAVFDFSVCIESSFHYEDKLKFFQEVFRVTKPGGVAVIADITCTDLNALRFKDSHFFESPAAYIGFAEKAGFDVLSQEDIGVSVFPQLYQHILNYNHTQARTREAKYWSLIANNYKTMSQQEKIGYHVFAFKKQ